MPTDYSRQEQEKRGTPECFYQLTFEPNSGDSGSVTFEGNLAEHGGNDIYSVPLNDTCTVYDNITSVKAWESIFHFQPHQATSSISSCPKRICICDPGGKPQCANLTYIFYEMSAIPGQTFSLSVASVGDEFGPVTGAVYAKTLDNNTFFTQNYQEVNHVSCTELHYTLHLENAVNVTEAQFMLSTNRLADRVQRSFLSNRFSEQTLKESIASYEDTNVIPPELLYTPVIVTLKVSTECPLGFKLLPLSNNPVKQDYICRCDEWLTTDQAYVTDCTLKNDLGIFSRNGTNWLGTDESNKSILASSFCPFSYCKDEMVAVNVYEPDFQCDLNRSGVLCGCCADNYSLAIGSSACIKCTDDNNIALLIPFIGAGIALVALIKILDITVAHGTINGLVLYANLLWINSGTFFPSFNESEYQHLAQFFNFLRGFTAWLNLDFGIQACFFQGLDAYVKTWLQFVFPAYVCGLVLLIILICRYSQWATLLFQKNAVPVLATLLLLSYVKLLRNVVNIFSPALLEENSEGKICTQFKWLLDGNIGYLTEGKHIGLFIFGVLLVLVFFLPFIAMLLFKRCPSIIPFACFKRLLFKLKPLLDAYTGPLKDKHQYWVGLTLLARIFLGVTTATFQARFPRINIVLLGVVSVVLFVVVTRVYKRWYILFLEILFLFNVILLCFGFLVTDELLVKVILTTISVCVSFFVFVGIIVLHTVWLVQSWLQNGVCRCQYQNIDTDEHGTGGTQDTAGLTATDIDYRRDAMETGNKSF